MSAPVEEVLTKNSYAAFYDSRANGGFGGNVARGGFFADAVIERYQADFFWNRVTNVGDAAGVGAIALGLAPDGTATKVGAGVLVAVSAGISVATTVRSILVGETATEAMEEFVAGGVAQGAAALRNVAPDGRSVSPRQQGRSVYPSCGNSSKRCERSRPSTTTR